MTPSRYEHPPITEAVIEIRFASPIDTALITKMSDKFRDFYPEHQFVKSYKVAVDVAEKREDPVTANIDQDIAHRRSSSDMSQLLILSDSIFSISQLPPYPGWESFYDRFVRDWKTWKKIIKFRGIARIGVRYINRIDIPVSGSTVEHEEYLNVYPKLPDIVKGVEAYAVQAVIPLEDIGCKLTLNSAVVPSPLIGYMSYVVDQDIAKIVDVPQKDEDIYQLLKTIRESKNSVFESCITNRARELF